MNLKCFIQIKTLVIILFLTLLDCGTVPTLTNGARSDTGGTTYGETATFACNTGYTISGGADVTCQDDGTWETLLATCTIKGKLHFIAFFLYCN